MLNLFPKVLSRIGYQYPGINSWKVEIKPNLLYIFWKKRKDSNALIVFQNSLSNQIEIQECPTSKESKIKKKMSKSIPIFSL